jgi:hypothetical protein
LFWTGSNTDWRALEKLQPYRWRGVEASGMVKKQTSLRADLRGTIQMMRV